jgi:hypothetical protein
MGAGEMLVGTAEMLDLILARFASVAANCGIVTTAQESLMVKFLRPGEPEFKSKSPFPETL